MTVDEIFERYADGTGDDWAFWVYLCDEPVRCARAVHLRQRTVELAWSPAAEDETCYLATSRTQLLDEACIHWVELLYEGAAVYRCLAVRSDEDAVSLPCPQVEPGAEGEEPVLWVSGRAHRLLRLANQVDPESGDYEASFLRAGIEVR